jgi:hypothetical protein
VHVNWPSSSDPVYLANPTEQNARKTCYNVTSVPWTEFDGVIHSSNYLSSYNTRMAVPSYLDIAVCRNGSTSTGDVSIRLVAEQDLGLTSLRLFTTLVQDDAPGAGYWSGSSFPYAFRDNLFGVVGPTVVFSAPYPDTLFFETPYTLDPGWTPANMYLITFVQQYATGLSREIANSRFDNFLGLPTGIEDSPAVGSRALAVYPNPSGGLFSIEATLPEGISGSVRVYDLAGRTVFEGDASQAPLQISVAQPGIYLVRLVTDDGASLERSVAVVE